MNESIQGTDAFLFIEFKLQKLAIFNFVGNLLKMYYCWREIVLGKLANYAMKGIMEQKLKCSIECTLPSVEGPT